MKDLYDSLYGDEGHMIYAFMEYADSQYITWIYTAGWRTPSWTAMQGGCSRTTRTGITPTAA